MPDGLSAQWAAPARAHGGLRRRQPRQARLRGRRHPRHARGGGQAPGHRLHRRHRRPGRDAGRRRRHLGDEHRPRRDRRQDLHAGRRCSSASASRRRRSPTTSASRATRRTTSPACPASARRRRRSCCSSSAPSTRCTRAWTRSSRRSGARCSRSTRQAARLSLQLATMVLDVPLEHDLVELVTTLRLPAAGRVARRRLRALRVPQPAPPPQGDLGGRRPSPRRPARRAAACRRRSCGWPPSRTSARVAALLEKGEAALAFEPRGDGGRPRRRCPRRRRRLPRRAGRRRPRRLALAAGRRTSSRTTPSRCPGFVSARRGPAFDTAVAAYLLAPERPEKERTLFALAGADDGAQLVEGPAAEAAAATRATLTWRVAEAQRPRLVELGLERLFREVELPLVRVLAQMEAAGVKMDPYRLGEITARVRDRIDELADEITRAGRRPVHHRLAAAARRGALRAPRPRQRPQGQDRLLDRRARAARAARPARHRAGWSRSGGSSPSCSTPTSSRSRPASTRSPAGCTPPSTSWWRPPAGSRAPTPTCRTSRCAPSWARRSAPASSPKRAASCSSPTTRRSSCGSWRRSRGEPALLDAYHRGEDVHRVTAAAVAGIPVEEVTKRQRERAKATNFGIMYGLSAFGLSEQVEIPVEEARAFIDAYFAKYPQGEGVPRARHRAGDPGRLRDHAVRPPARRARAALVATSATARWASGSR